MAVPTGPRVQGAMSRRSREHCPNAYTPCHMDDGALRTRRQPMGMMLACAGARPRDARIDIVSQADAGATLRLEPHPRERSME